MRALLLEPFWAYGFMHTALAACLGLALANAPVGVLLLQRRMSLTADVLSHAVMPGAALGFLVAGYSVLALSLGASPPGYWWRCSRLPPPASTRSAARRRWPSCI